MERIAATKHPYLPRGKHLEMATETKSFKPLICALLALPAAFLGACGGMTVFQWMIYALAELTDRDVAELKDMLIWSFITGIVVGAIAGIWLILFLARAGKGSQRAALISLAVAVIGGSAMMTAAFDWPKSSGTPIIQYELRLPVGAPLPERDKIDITVWNEKMGQGCYIAQIRMADGRPEITGDLTLYTTNSNPTMSLQLNRNGAGYWKLPYKPDTPLEKSFGPWQRIEFIPTPRANVPPLPAGEYEIRYRVRKYM